MDEPIKNSILNDVKAMLGMTSDYDSDFDIQLILHINTIFSVLTQLGVGPADGYSITSDHNTWDEFIGENLKLSDVKTLVYLRVRLIFDPPTTGAVMESYNKTISELEWRIATEVNYGKKQEDE